MSQEPPLKRRRLSAEPDIQSLKRSISPPSRKPKAEIQNDEAALSRDKKGKQRAGSRPRETQTLFIPSAGLRSPFRLTKVTDLDDAANADTISLGEMLGNPLLKEVWLFDYLFDLDFVMKQFDRDATPLVKIVHGSWRRESEQRIHLEEASKSFSNVEVIAAYMPEPFGTHHSKMMVLFRHDDVAQVIIHTANMIPFDWANMAQGAWLSPHLPLLSESEKASEDSSYTLGSGERFKLDLVRYLKQYQRKTSSLISNLEKYDFSAIQAAFIGSAPTKEMLDDADPSKHTSFGWPGLNQILKTIASKRPRSTSGEVVMQVSSIASFTEKWLDNFVDVLHTDVSRSGGNPSRKTKLVFPTAEDIRNSLNGYASGGSIHLKGSSAAQKKQISLMRPMLCRWSGPPEWSTEREDKCIRGSAMRDLAAPHIKTFIKYTDDKRISWALLTSANLSQQAWGALPDKEGRVRICSWEVGVLVWPELFERTVMVPVFGEDRVPGEHEESVPLRIPYDLPLQRYKDGDEPWCRSEAHSTPDWLGRKWPIG